MTAPASRPALRDARAGGLHLAEWPGAEQTVLCLPGLTSSSRVFTPLAEALPEARVLAPDLRGRGASVDLSGPPGLRAHAADVAALVDQLDLTEVVLVGHSMGAYLAPLVAQLLGERVRRLVLADGGIPPQLPPLLGPRLVRRVFRRDLRRAARDWPDARTFVQELAGKALRNRPELVDRVAAWGEHDLAGPPGALRPRLDLALAEDDAVDSFFGGHVVPALEALRVPAHLLAATAGKHDRAKPFLSARVVQEWTARQPLLTAERVAANHLTLLFAPELVRAVRG